MTSIPSFLKLVEQIPITLYERTGKLEIFYGSNEDPIEAGFDALIGLNFDISRSKSYPVLHARIVGFAGSGYRTSCGWLQIVTNDYSMIVETETPPIKTVEVDLSPVMHQFGIPFCSLGNLPQFYDAPCCNLGEYQHQKWVADTFLTTIPSRSIAQPVTYIAGFRWGYTEKIASDQNLISILPLEVTNIDAWNELVPVLRAEFPAWTFLQGKGS